MYKHQTIAAYREALLLGKITCTGVVSEYLARIKAAQHLNAFVEVFEKEALAQAHKIDNALTSGKKLGRLAGVVIGIKDVICYQGHKVTAASRILAGFTSLYSATAVQRLLDEDAIIIGSLNCDEFAMGSSNENSAYGKVLNAWDETRVPGGSSGGSAVAVQANLCMVSLGSDTGGSVRQPADFCGIIGLKPSYGRISRHGLIAYASSFDQIGIFSRNIEDIALLLEIMAGPDEYDSTVSATPVPAYSKALESEEKYRFAYFPECFEHPSLDSEIRTAGLALLEKLQTQGHTIQPVNFPFLDFIVPTYYILTTAEASSNLSRYDGIRYGNREIIPDSQYSDFFSRNRSASFGREVKRRIMLGNFVLSTGYHDAFFTKAQQVRRLIINKTDDVFKHHDLLLMPTVPSPAFRFGEKTSDPIAMYLGDLYTVYANLAGIPALSIPLNIHNSGMPFGIQVLSDRYNELTLLRASQVVTDASPITGPN